MILIIDHYDSFSQSLYQLVRKCCQETEMIRSDQATVEEIRQMKPQMIILSTGAGKPEEAGVFLETVKELGSQIPILGIGLGYLAVCSAFGGRLKERENPVCAGTVTVEFEPESRLFKAMGKTSMEVGVYGFLTADKDSLPGCLKAAAKDPEGDVMAVEHREYPVYGICFQPESVLTPNGRKLMENLVREEVLNKMTSSRILSKIKEILKDRQAEEDE